MADSLALSITVPLGSLPEFIATLSAHLEPGTACTEQDLLATAGSDKELALTLRFTKDAALAQFQDDHPDIECTVPGQVALGYLFVKARKLPESAEISTFTSSRDMVQVLKESGQVRALFLRLGMLGSPQEVRVTDEWNDVQIWQACKDSIRLPGAAGVE